MSTILSKLNDSYDDYRVMCLVKDTIPLDIKNIGWMEEKDQFLREENLNSSDVTMWFKLMAQRKYYNPKIHK